MSLASNFWQRIRRRIQQVTGGSTPPPSSEYDSNAAAFFAVNTGLTTPQKNAVNTLVIALKANGLWSRLYAIYPIVGGTADSHKWNLKNPANTDAAKRLVWFGGWAHGITGATPNGTNAYAKTWIDPHEDCPQYSFSGFVYNRTASNPTSDHVLFGGKSTGDPVWLDIFLAGATPKIDAVVANNGQRVAFNNTLYQGTIGLSCYHSDKFNVYRNGIAIASNTGNRTRYFDNIDANNENGKLYLGGYNNNETAQWFSPYEISFACFGWGLDSSQVATLNSIITNFQTALDRNV